ncbi:hypothetical protein DF044_08455 [Burkholderia contaminans]|uniref:Uncharacterized protein n=1 Tax=Burkholderia contaminans TaxID=488447 RepID=A0A3N8Q9Z6_9BURK|nr:hypothetical protein DF044_08455 [Burkholderia contaminans]RQT25507.1 hypothetical protein DF037_21490 [Burkholderia contaminans]TCW69458.1 hypothetical protein C5O79_16160 [Burkholderia sp. SRS-25]
MRRGGGEHERCHAREAAGRRKGKGKPGVPFHRESFFRRGDVTGTPGPCGAASGDERRASMSFG